MQDPVHYTVEIDHWQDGTVEVTVHEVGDSDQDKQSVAYALREAARKVEEGTPVSLRRLS